MTPYIRSLFLRENFKMNFDKAKQLLLEGKSVKAASWGYNKNLSIKLSDWMGNQVCIVYLPENQLDGSYSNRQMYSFTWQDIIRTDWEEVK